MANFLTILFSKPLFEIIIIMSLFFLGFLIFFGFIIQIIKLIRSEEDNLSLSFLKLFSIRRSTDKNNTKRNNIKEIIQKEEANKHEITLAQHRVFISLQRKIGNTKIPHKKEDKFGKLKSIIADEFLDIKIRVFHDRLKEFVCEFSQEKREEERMNLLTTLNVKLTEWIKEYNDKARNHVFVISDDYMLKSIPEPFIEGFDKWHNFKVQLVGDKIQESITSSFYKSPEMKLILILEYVDFAFDLTLEDARQTVMNINGKLETILEPYLKQE